VYWEGWGLSLSLRQKQAIAENLRDNMTWPERILWSRLRHRQIGYSFQAQAVVRGYVVDFWCPVAKIVVEVDGKWHEEAQRIESDKERDRFLSKSGVKVLRFKVSDVMKGMSAVLIRVWNECHERAPEADQIKVAPLLEGGKIASRHCESVEMRALRRTREAKRLEEHEAAFVRRYRERSVNTVGSRWKPGNGKP
jgi:very-short-patch-repair endonuclease